jgi:hypothetical protein
MAGNWIKFETSTSDKPEVWQIAESLGIDPDAVVGKLLRIWAWFDDQTESGNAPVTVAALLDRRVGVSGFVSAMVSAGWMTQKSGVLTLPNFDRHNGETAKSRALTAKRVAKHKEKGSSATNAVANGLVTVGALPKEEKNREEGKEAKASSSKANKSPSEPAFNPSECSFPIFPCSGADKTWQATDRQLADWSEAYPAVDIERAHRRAHAWIMANLAKRKTATGYAKFLTAWLSKEQDSGKSQRPAMASVPHKATALTKAEIEELNRTGDVERFLQ